MITRITGLLVRVLDEEVRLQVGPLEYSVLVPEFVRRAVQMRLGRELSFHTMHYFDGDPSRGRVVPRLVGFLHEVELEFFELFCTVDKVGTRKALKALTRPVKEIADAIQRQDTRWLATLPGIGTQTADKIVATLRRKVTRFALMAAPRTGLPAVEEVATNGTAARAAEPAAEVAEEAPVLVEGSVIEDAYQALMSLGHSPAEARTRIDQVLATGKAFAGVDEVLVEIYQKR
jgi:Holliday junction DNA helicase RuvA